MEIKKEEGLTFIEAGERFGMSLNTIFKWTKRIERKRKWGKNRHGGSEGRCKQESRIISI